MRAGPCVMLGVAYRDVERLPKNADEIETRLVFCGLLGMIDPPRPQAKAAVRECQQAGILPVMITGDHIVTARPSPRNWESFGARTALSPVPSWTP